MTGTAVERLSNGVVIDQEAVLNAIGLNPRDPKAQAVVLICERYALDPILKHVILVQGNVFITRAGYLHIAHSSGKFDGIEVVDQGETASHYTAKVAVYRKDMSRPFVYPGRYPKDASQAKKYGPEMAVTRAEVNALRRAFDVDGIDPDPELDDDYQPVASVQPEVELVEVSPEELHAARDLETAKSRLHSLSMHVAEDKRPLLGKAWKDAGLPQRDKFKSLTAEQLPVAQALVRQWVALSALALAGFTSEKQRHEAVRAATGGETESTKDLSERQLEDIAEYCKALAETNFPVEAPAPRVEHSIAVKDTVEVGPGNQSAHTYRAGCSCGWCGRYHRDEQAAVLEGEEHTVTVARDTTPTLDGAA